MKSPVSNLATGQSVSRLRRLAAAEDSLWIGTLLTATGGFLDAFTYLAHGHVFANAMSGNVVLLAVFALTGGWRQSLRHIPPILAFLLGVVAAQLFQRSRFGKSSLAGPALMSLTAEMVFLFVAGWFPRKFPSLPLVLGISFLAALQSSTFRRIEQWTYNSTMTTGNLRLLGEAWFNAISARADQEANRKAKLFTIVCLSFLAGAMLAGFCTPRMSNRALWVVDALLFLAWFPLMAAWSIPRKGRTPAASSVPDVTPAK